ncbi:MAG: hypothetical protein RIK87_24925 [Fuerstiella sp.]
MVQEIIYTSAPKGLRQGSRGFCTVVSTAGMAANMAERLESMSGYRHAFPLHDPNVGLNPVNYAHVTTRMAGQKLHVISRVADAGQDYSGRTNKLAHHIVVDDIGALPAGPARVLADASTVVTEWDGQLASKPTRALTSPAIPEIIRLSAWKSATGDEGWAGYVAEQLLNGRAPVNVIFAAGTDTLALLIEVLDLIPVPQRWGITFSTYFTRLQAGTECQLRFFLDGTAEATSLRNDARAVKVDLTGALGEAAGGALVEQARAGVLEFRRTAPPKVQPAKRRPAVSDDELEGLLAAEGNSDSQQDAETYRLQKPISRLGSPPPVSRIESAFRRKESGKGSWVIAVLVLLLLGGLGAGVFFAVPPILQNLKQQRELAQAVANDTSDLKPELPSDSEAATERDTLAFDGQSPFELLDGNGVSSPSQFELPELDKAEDRTLFHLLTDEISGIEFRMADKVGDLSLSKPHAMEPHTWTLLHGDSMPIASIELRSEIGVEGVEVVWRWDDDVIKLDALRAAAYGLRDQAFTVVAPANRKEAIAEQRNIRFEVPKLFGGDSPLSDLPHTKDGETFQWSVEKSQNAPLKIKAYSVHSVKISTVPPKPSELKIEPRVDGSKYQVSWGQTNIGVFRMKKAEKAGISVEWMWAESDQDSASFVIGKYQLSKIQFNLAVHREDGIADSTHLQIKFPSPPLFGESGPKFEESYLLPLPNPIRMKSLPEEDRPLLQRWHEENVALALHPEFSKLIKTPGRSLSLVTVEANKVWEVQIRDRVESDGTLVARPISLGRYTLVRSVVTGPHYRLSFEWLPDAERELSAAELVRWCPLIITSGNESRAFLQRLPDRWTIPSWGRQKGFVLEQNYSPDDNRTGREFADLRLRAGKNALFRLTFDVEGDAGPVAKVFRGTLEPDEKGVISHRAWFPVEEPVRLQEGETPLDSAYGLLDTKIILPAEDSAHPTFEILTTAYVRLNAARFAETKFRVPAWNSAADGAETTNVYEKPAKGEIGIVPLLKVKAELQNQLSELSLHTRQVRDQAKHLDQQDNESIRVNTKLLSLTSEPQRRKVIQDELDKVVERINSRANQIKELLELKQKYSLENAESPYCKSLTDADFVEKTMENCRLSLSLGMKLSTSHPVTITFVDARMENPDDRR